MANIQIEIHTASFRSTRGYSVVAFLGDEFAFLPTDENSAEPDAELIAAIKPGMATVPQSMLLVASSPYARRGTLWDAYRKHFGKDGDPVLVWQSDTRSMNPSVPQAFIDQHMAEDEARARAEYLGEFRIDIENLFVRENVVANVTPCCAERPREYYKTYVGFVDPSGGSSDSMTLAIAHRDIVRKVVVIDAIREVKPPFSPEAVVYEFATLLKIYNVSRITGDRYAGEWPRESFRKQGISYEPSGRKPKASCTSICCR